jgi:hypothetical protein
MSWESHESNSRKGLKSPIGTFIFSDGVLKFSGLKFMEQKIQSELNVKFMDRNLKKNEIEWEKFW